MTLSPVEIANAALMEIGINPVMTADPDDPKSLEWSSDIGPAGYRAMLLGIQPFADPGERFLCARHANGVHHWEVKERIPRGDGCLTIAEILRGEPCPYITVVASAE